MFGATLTSRVRRRRTMSTDAQGTNFLGAVFLEGTDDDIDEKVVVNLRRIVQRAKKILNDSVNLLVNEMSRPGHGHFSTSEDDHDFVVYYESIKRKMKRRLIYEYGCDERLQTKTEESTRLAYAVLFENDLTISIMNQ